LRGAAAFWRQLSWNFKGF